MPDRTPAQTIHAAASRLRELATAANAINPGPWEPRLTHPELPDSDFYRLWAADRSAILHGGRPAVRGAVAHPSVGLAVARMLEQAAEALIGQDVPADEPALATARAILAEVTE